MEQAVEKMDNETILILSGIGAFLLFLIDYGIQYLYSKYQAKQIPETLTSKRPSDDLIFRKTSKLVRFFSSEFVRFECPREMRVGKRFSGCLHVRSGDELRNEFKHDADLKLSIQPWIKADIGADDFEIKINSDEFQHTQNNSLAWDWSIMPLKEGIHGIALYLVFTIESSFGEVVHRMWIDERTVMVSANIFSATWLWLKSKWKRIAAVLIEITVFYFLLKFIFELG